MQGRFWGDRVEIKKIWDTRYVPFEKAEKLACEAGISIFSGKIFLRAEGWTVLKIDKFLNSTLEDLNDPFLLKDMDVAAERISKAVRKREKGILIYGD